MNNKENKVIIIFSTQRSGSTMVTSDFTETQVLGNPSEYFTQKILPGSKFNNCSLTTEQIKEEIKNILEKAKTSNGVICIKVMSDYITEIGKSLEKIGITPKNNLVSNQNLTGQEKISYLQSIFVDFFNSLDIDNQFIAFRVYRKDKIKQAVSRFVAATTGLYHVWRDDHGKLLNHYDRPAEKATPFSLDVDKSYEPTKIASIIDSIYREERELDIFLENFKIPTTNLIYENITSDTKYLESTVKKLPHFADLTTIDDIERKTVKTTSAINKELIQRFSKDGNYKSEFDYITSVKSNIIKHIVKTPDTIKLNELCFWNKQIVDIKIDQPSLKSDNKNLLKISGVIVTNEKIKGIFIFDPNVAKKYQADIELKSEYFGSIYWGVVDSDKARFCCFIPLDNKTMNIQKPYNVELNYMITNSSSVKLLQIDISDFLR